MGFVKNAVKKVGGTLFGGGGPQAATDPNLGPYQQAAYQGIANRLGAKKKYNADGSDAGYDFSNTNNPIYGRDLGGRYLTGSQSHDFSAINKAIQGFSRPTQLSQTYTSNYNPTSYKASLFDYKGLPEQYYNDAYAAGSKNVRREGQGALEKLRETVGTRRPGLLLKAGEDNQRATGESLAALSRDLGLERMRQGVDLGVKQQQDQAGENLRAAQFGEGQAQFGAGEGYKGYQSRADLEGKNADNAFRNLQALNEAGQNKLVTQANLLNNERNYQGEGLDALIKLLTGAQGTQNQAANINEQKRRNTLDFLGNAANAGASIAGLCLPKDTKIETDNGYKLVQDIIVGDKVRGGTVLKTSKTERPEGHVFTEHKFANGTVIMTDGHPYFDKLEYKKASDQDSDATYDILTDSGYYYVNGVKLGSTIEG